MKNKKGFTLVEILVVLSIIAILMVIAIPGINKLSSNLKDRGSKSETNLIEKAAVLYAENNSNSIKNRLEICNESMGTSDYCTNESKCIKTSGNTCEKSIDDYKYKCYMELEELISLGYYKNDNSTITSGYIVILIDADYKTSSAKFQINKPENVKNCAE